MTDLNLKETKIRNDTKSNNGDNRMICTHSALQSFVKGFLAPLDAISSMYGIARRTDDSPFRNVTMRPPQSDLENIRKDFSAAIARVKRENAIATNGRQ